MFTDTRVAVTTLVGLMAITLIGGFFQHNTLVIACEPHEEVTKCALRAQSKVVNRI